MGLAAGLHFLLHSYGPGRLAAGSLGIISAASGVCPAVVASSPPSAPAPAVAVHIAVAAQPLCGSAERCASAAPVPGRKSKGFPLKHAF